MNLSQIKRQRNGKRGAVRTEAILLDGFMVLERSMDIDGADYLIQEIPAGESEQKASKDKTLATGRVQAKFFEKNNQQKIARSYIENAGGTRPDFFVFLHTDDSNENNTYFFFTAQEIMANWHISKCGKYYRFGLSAKRDYAFFRNRDRKKIFSLIKEGIHDSKYYQSLLAVERFYKTYVDVRESIPSPHIYTYLFKIIEGCHLVLCRDETSGDVRFLEPRRDLFPYSGDFTWGYKGTGPRFLSISVLGHHLGGLFPANKQIEKFLEFISNMNVDIEWQLTSDLVDNIISV